MLIRRWFHGYKVIAPDGVSNRLIGQWAYELLMSVIRAYVAKRYFNLKATVDVQITALFLNSSSTVT